MSTEMLSSDVIEKQFGPSTLRVVSQSEDTRISTTEITATGRIVEVSKVSFIHAGISAYPEVHRQVLAGKSMGKAFRASNIMFNRKVISSQVEQTPRHLRKYLVNDNAVTVIHVNILVGPEKVPYADILETYSTDIHWGQAEK